MNFKQFLVESAEHDKLAKEAVIYYASKANKDEKISLKNPKKFGITMDAISKRLAAEGDDQTIKFQDELTRLFRAHLRTSKLYKEMDKQLNPKPIIMRQTNK
jgi:hypothetical protein